MLSGKRKIVIWMIIIIITQNINKEQLNANSNQRKGLLNFVILLEIYWAKNDPSILDKTNIFSFFVQMELRLIDAIFS